MINTQQLQKIFKPNKYKIYSSINYIIITPINNNKKRILICDEVMWKYLINSQYTSHIIRKNCLISKTSHFLLHNLNIEICLHTDYIQFIIRNKSLNFLIYDR